MRVYKTSVRVITLLLVINKIANLIFESGVTTSEKEELIAGRGVGMDLVKKRIDKYNGHIEIKSEKNKFCEFIISLPK